MKEPAPQQPFARNSPEFGPTAYKRFHPPIYGVLRQLNEGMALTATADPTSWLIDMLSFSVRIEALETAHGLLTHILLREGYLGEDQLSLLLPYAVDVLLSSGETAEARLLLLRHVELVALDDRLASVFFDLLEGDLPEHETISENALLLPSGHVNAFFVAPRAERAAHGLLALYMKSHGLFRQSPSLELIMANAVRNRSKEGWIGFWNKFLRTQALPAILEADPAAPNFLDQLRFEPAPDSPAPIEGEPRVSILLSAYQSARTLAYALRSLLEQTYRNIEILFCDDGSSDDTTEIVARVADPRLRVFRSTANQGTYNIRNALIAQATGDYVTFQDSDDFALPNRIEYQLREILRNGALGAVARWIRVRPDGEVVFFRDHSCIRMCVVSFMARASLFRELGAYRGALCGADSEIYEMARALHGDANILQIEKPLLLGLWSSASLTQSAGTEALNDGYRSPARRAYAEVAARQRLLGRQIVPDEAVMAVLQETGLARAPQGIEPLDPEPPVSRRPRRSPPASRSPGRASRSSP